MNKILQCDPEKLCSFSLGYICTSNEINTPEAELIGRKMLTLLDGGTFSSKLPMSLKCKSFDFLKKSVKVSNKKVVLEPLKLFNRLMIIIERNLTVEESLAFELIVVTASLGQRMYLCYHETVAH